MVLVAVFMHHNLFLVTLIMFDKCRKITEICQIKCEKVRKIPEFSSPHNPEVVGSSPASATIRNTGFRKKPGVFLTFRDGVAADNMSMVLDLVFCGCLRN